MEPEKGVIEKGRSVRDMHHLRLMSLLQELERDNGRKKTAEILGVDRRTLDASLDEGVLTRRIRNALQKALQSGVGSAAAEQRDRNDLLADRLEDLEGRVEEQGTECRVGRRHGRTQSGPCVRRWPRAFASWRRRWRSVRRGGVDRTGQRRTAPARSPGIGQRSGGSTPTS